MAELLAGDRGLAEGDAAVVGGDFAMGEYFEAFAAQRFEAASEQERVLEASATQADAVKREVGAHAAANFNNGGDERLVESGGDGGLCLAGFESSDNLVNHGAEVDFGGRSTSEREVVLIWRRIAVGVGGGFEHHGGLAFEGDGMTEADE